MKNLINYLSKKSLSLGNGPALDRRWTGHESGRFLSILTLFLTLFSFGVGNAWGADETLTIDYSSFSSHGTSYTDKSWSASSSPSSTSISGSATVCFKDGEDWIQIKNGHPAFRNTTALPGAIKSVTLTRQSEGSNRTVYLYVGTEELTNSNYTSKGTSLSSKSVTTSGVTWTLTAAQIAAGYKYFYFYGSSNTLYLDNAVITYAGGTSYTLTFKEYIGGGTASGSPSTGSVTANATSFSFGATAPSKTGYSIEGFYTNTSASSGVKVADGSRNFIASIASWTDANKKYTKGSDANLYINWTPKVTTLTLDKGTDGTSNGTASVTYGNAALTSITHATKTGYHLNGYYTAASGGSKVLNADGTFATSSLSGWISSSKWAKDATEATLYAQWTIDTYTVNWVANGTTWTGASHGTPSTSANYNNKVATIPTAPTSSDCDNTKVFVGWTNSEYSHASTAPILLFKTQGASPKITANTTFYAVFANQSGTAPTYTEITSDVNSEGVYVLVSEYSSNYYYLPNTESSSNPSLGSGITMKTSAGVTTLTNAMTDDMLWDLTEDTNYDGYYHVRPHGSTTIGLGTTNSTGTNIRITSDYADDSFSFATTSSSQKWDIYNGHYLAVYSASAWRNYSNNTTNQNGVFHIFKQSGGYTYTNYATSCCTPLGTINGSISWSNATTAVVSWNNLANVSSWTVKYKTHAAGEYTTWAGDQTVYTKSTTNDSRKVTITGLTACTDYDFQIIANPASGYCDKDETIEDSQTHNYTVTSTGVTNVTPSSDFPTTTCTGFSITSMTAADGYHLPTSITVTNADKTWNSSTGALTISNVTGNVTITITAELDACDVYSFFYGTSKGFENNFECFSQVGTSTTWLTGLWTIPSADQWTYVGEPNWDPSPGKSANLQLSNMPYALNHANNLGSICSGVMEGAQGYIKINDDSTDPNRYVGFIPAGYVFRWGSGESWTSYPFTGKTNAIEEEDWNTALQTWTSSNADDFTYVGLKTSSGYVWANRSETRRPVFFKPNANWLTKDGESKDCKFAMYYYSSDEAHNGWSAFMEDVDGDGIYEAWIPNDYEYAKVIFVRFPNSKASTGNWDNEMNQTGNLSLQSDKNVFTMAAGKWGTEADEGSWSLYDKKGTFHISANSNTNNWYCHFLPHHVLTYNANGGSGAPDVQSVAINASPCQITVAAGSGMTPPTGYSFIGWNPDESEADAGNVDSDYDPNDTPTMSGDITLYAVWQANSIALTLDKNNSDASGSSNGSGSIDYDAASGTITTAATRTGYHVEGYYAEAGCTNKVLEDDGDVINSTVSGYTSSGKWARTTDPTTLYTKWTANEYTISLDDQSATTSASISSITVTFNANTNLTGTVVATRPTKTGYQFGGYYTGTSGSGSKIINADGTVVAGVSTYTNASKNWIKASNVDLYAYWLPIYAITWSVNGSALTGDALDGASTEVVSGGTISGVPSTAPADNTLNNCANKFMGWSRTNITKGSPVTDDDDIAALGLFTEASGYTTAISGATTFYAVFAEQEGGVTATSITSYEDGDYYLIQSFTDSESNTKYVSPTGAASTSVGIVDLTSDVSVSSGVLTLDLTSGSLTNAMVYTLSHESSTYYIYNASVEKYIGSNNSAALTIGKNGWLLLPEDANNKRYMFWRDESTDRCLLYQDTYSNSGTKTSSQIFKCYAKSLAGDISQQSGKECYGSGYFFLVPATGATYTNYVTQCADNQVRVTYDFNGGTGDACTEGVTRKSASYTVCSTEPEKDYYDFAGWNDGSSTYNAGATGYNLQATTTFTAVWTPTVYTITYNLNGGTQQVDPAPATSYTYESSAVTLPTAPTYGHNRFDGWYGNSDLSTGGVQTTIAAGSNGSKEYWAKWTTRNEIKFYKDDELLATIYRAADENLQASVAGQGSKPDDPSAPSACSSKVFMGWTETWFNDETNTAPADLNDATGTRSGAKTYYAVWATRAGDPGSYTYSAYSTTCCSKQVTLSDGSPSNGTVTFNHDFVWTCKGSREVEMTVTPNSGYYLSAWSTSGVTPTSVEPAISYGSVSDNGAQVATVTFAQNTTAGTYTASATFTPIPVSSLALTVQQTGQSDKVGNDLTMNCYPKEGQTGGNDPLNHTLKVNFTEVLPSSALDKTVDWSVRVKATGDADWTDVGFTDNALNKNSIINSYNKSTGNLQIKATEGTAEIKITAHDGSGVTAKVTITVTNVALSSLNVAKSSTTLYVGESEEIAVTYDPVNTTTKGYTTGSYSYVTIGNTNDVITLTGKAATSEVTERVTLTSKDAGAKTATIDVTVKPLPTITFVDLIHNKTDFANSGDGWTAGTGVLSSTAAAGVVSHSKKTPTHADLAEPATGNACEKGHLHLVGWIRSDFSKVVDYLDGTGAAPSISDLTTAGATYWFLPDASINVETLNGKMFYAVWAVEDEL